MINKPTNNPLAGKFCISMKYNAYVVKIFHKII